MNKKYLLMLLLMSFLAACSPRSEDANLKLAAGTPEAPGNTPTPGGTNPTPTVPAVKKTRVTVITDNSMIQTGGSEIAKITVLVKNEDNILVEGEKVSFSSTGGALKVISAETSADGTAVAELSLEGDPLNQNIIVSATADSVTASVQIKAAGTGVIITGPTALVAGDSADISAVLTAGNGEPISNEVIVFTSASSNSITPDSAITNENGQVHVVVSSTAGSDTITATSLGGNVVSTYTLNVADDLLTFVNPLAGSELKVSEPHTIMVKWFSDGAAVVGQELSFGVTSGQIVGSNIAQTNNEGIATIQITSVSAGEATITVEANGNGEPATTLDVEFVATVPNTIAVTAAPRVVDTSSSTVITARILDANSNPVKGKIVRFETAEAFGGVLSPSATTDINGLAAVTFIAGSLATEEDQLVIVATVAENTGITSSVRLTVNKRELNVTLGSTNNLRSLANDTQYSQPFVVQVADGSGQAVKNATITLSYHVTWYKKGTLTRIDTDGDGEPDVWGQPLASEVTGGLAEKCEAEDTNKNGSLDIGEDINSNNILDPQNPAVLTAEEGIEPTLQSGSIISDKNGFGYFSLVYPQSNAWWSVVEITASATAQNVEAESTFTSYLAIMADQVKDIETSPPNVRSPYGIELDCTNPN